jgi:hypothetical protein
MSKNYKLLTTAIVSALNRSEATPRGAVWTPGTTLDDQEAEALVRLGYAETTTKEATHFAPGERKPKLSGVTVDAIKQPDGTYKNGNGIRVNEDGSEYVPTAEEALQASYAAFLARPADQVLADIAQPAEEGDGRAQHFAALVELEKAGKKRSSIIKALSE